MSIAPAKTSDASKACRRRIMRDPTREALYPFDRYGHRDMIEITAGLFLGDEFDAGNLRAMQDRGIHAVINCAPRVPNHFEGGDIAYLHLDIEESSEITREIAMSVLSFSREHASRGGILVHCAGGNQRSPAIIMLLLTAGGTPLLDAFKLVEQKRGSIITPTFTMVASIARLNLDGCDYTEDDVRRHFKVEYNLRF